DAVEGDIFSERFLLTRPLLEAIRAEDDVVLLIDEVDRLDVETEALLLEILSDFQVSIPELGTIRARRRPLVVLTSNDSRELSEALKRRCLYLHVGYPSAEREREIVLARVPGISEELATGIAETIRSLRALDLKKRPSVSETLDWAHTLVLLGSDVISPDTVGEHLHVLLKHRSDLELAAKALGVNPAWPPRLAMHGGRRRARGRRGADRGTPRDRRPGLAQRGHRRRPCTAARAAR